MITESTNLRIVRISAWYDLAVGLAFATPLTLAATWSLLTAASVALGAAPLPVLDVYGVMFANFFGTVVTLWAVLRLARSKALFGRYDAAGRAAFAAWMVVALAKGATPILYGFVLIEVLLGLAQALPIRRAQGGATA